MKKETDIIGTYRIGGRLVCSMKNPRACSREELRRFIGCSVLLNGMVMECIGVESHCTPTIREGEVIGLIVKSPQLDEKPL